MKRGDRLIAYKKNLLEELKLVGYTTYRLRNEKLLGEVTIQKLRNGEMVTLNAIDTICHLLKCQPGDLIGYLHNEQDAFLPDEPLQPRVFIHREDEETLK